MSSFANGQSSLEAAVTAEQGRWSSFRRDRSRPTGDRAHAAQVHLSRRRLTAAGLIAGALALPNVTSAIGVALAPQLLAHAPLVLLALHPYAPVAVLVLPELPVTIFVLLAVLFRLGPRYLCFLAGRAGGQEELERYLSRHPGGRIARAMPTSRRMVSPALVIIASAPVSAMAGALGVGRRRFLAMSTIGATLPTLLLVLVGKAADDPVRWTAAAVRDRSELWWVVLLTVLLALAAWVLVRRRRPRVADHSGARYAREDQRLREEPDSSTMLSECARSRDPYRLEGRTPCTHGSSNAHAR